MKHKLLTTLAAAAALGAMALADPGTAGAAPVSDWDSDDNVLLVNEAEQVAYAVISSYPMLDGVIIGSEPLDADTYAGAYVAPDGTTAIALNDYWTSNPAGLDASIRADVASGFHPPLGNCSPVQLVMVHEAAHLLDALTGRTARAVVAQQLGGLTDLPLRRYSFNEDGTLNPGEALATAYASVICNGGTELEQAMAGLLP